MGEKKPDPTRVTMDELKAAVGESVTVAVREAIPGILEKLQPKKPTVKEVSSDLDPRERMGLFFRGALFGLDRVADDLVKKQLGEGTESAGGYLVPDEYRAELVKRLPELSELFAHVRQIPVASDAGSMPSLATDIGVSWDEAENAAFEEQTPAFGSITWAIHRANAFTKMSRELVADAAPKIADVVTDLFIEAMGAEMDRVIAIGNGTDEPRGLISAVSISSVSTGTITFAKLITVEFTLAKKYRKRARWVLNNTNVRRIQTLVDTNGQPLFRRDAGEHGAGTILGYPISQQDDLPDSEILFGDLRYYLWFDREQVGVEATTQGGNAFQYHQTWLKTWMRCDGKLGMDVADGPFVRADNIDG